jgi:hypothetical protein
MNNLNYDKIKLAYVKLGYRFHVEQNMLNLGGIRKENGTINKFDDILFEAYIDEDGNKVLNFYLGTTDPGLKYLRNPMNSRGCAAIVPGQYVNCRKIGKHRGDHWALVQCGNIAVYRDNNKDNKYDFIPSSIERGCGFGINRHRAALHAIIEDVNGYSAGCEVFKNSNDQEKEVELARKQVALTGCEYFDETLFLESEVV